jgi:hypothetical protein
MGRKSRRARGWSGSTHETRWRRQFACETPGPRTGQVWRLPESEYSRIILPVRADILEAVRKTGVEVTHVTPLEAAGRSEVAADRFEITYTRRGGEVAGVVEGTIRPDASGPDTRYTNLGL